MNEVKGFLQSRVILSALVGLVAMVLNMFGVSLVLDESTTSQIVNNVLNAVEAISFICAVVFRTTSNGEKIAPVAVVPTPSP